MKTYEERTDSVLEKVKEKREKQRLMKKWIPIASVTLAFLLAFNLVMFIPYTTGGFDAAAYKDSEYYPLIQKLSALTSDAPVTKNNFQRWFGDWGMKKGGALNDAAPSSPGTVNGGGLSSESFNNSHYEEVTDNQVDGVTEGDLFKRSSDHLFYLSAVSDSNNDVNLLLQIYSINGGNSAPVCDFIIYHEGNISFSGYQHEREMYLSEDLSTVTVITPCYNYSARQRYTAIISVDVSDFNSIKVTRTNYVSGSLVSSRIQGENLLIVSNFAVKRNLDFSDEKQFVPQIGTLNDMKSLPIGNIVLPDVATYARFTVLTTLDTDASELCDSIALLSYSDETYVSLENIYVTRSYSETGTYNYGDNNRYASGYTIQNYTEISRIGYTAEGELTLEAQGSVVGALKNRYCMDEYGETFRIITTVLGEPHFSNGRVVQNSESASLYVLNTNDLTVRNSVERFAPENESVQSARFNGDTAYVCTAVVRTMTDPVFQFDLSDPDHITYKDTGTIPGYSLNLTTFYEGTLLGIGYDEGRNLKIEVYVEGESTVESVAVYNTLNASFSEEYKAYLIDRENGYIGLAMQVYSAMDYSWSYEYRLLHFDGYELVEVVTVPLEGSGYNEARAFLTDGWLYVVDSNNFKTVKI